MSLRLSRRLQLAVVAVLIVTAGITVYIFVIRDDAEPQQPTDSSVVLTHSTDRPSEKKPDDDYVWRGAPGEPKKIIVPSLGIDAFVQKVGVDQNQQIAVPNNIHIAGWFVDSVRPGQNGLSIIDGHVDGRTVNEGVFARLGELKTDDEYSVQMGDDTVHHYRVHSIVTKPTNEIADTLYSQIPTITSQLNLITCAGAWLQSERTYDQRTVVISELLDGS